MHENSIRTDKDDKVSQFKYSCSVFIDDENIVNYDGEVKKACSAETLEVRNYKKPATKTKKLNLQYEIIKKNMSSLKETLNSLNQKVEQQSEDLVFVKIDRTKELEESICSKLEMIKNIKDSKVISQSNCSNSCLLF